jgi:hypothetical protein
MGEPLCMGLSLAFLGAPAPMGDRADDRPPAGLDGDPLDPDHLRLPLAPVPVERLEQGRVGVRCGLGRGVSREFGPV